MAEILAFKRKLVTEYEDSNSLSIQEVAVPVQRPLGGIYVNWDVLDACIQLNVDNWTFLNSFSAIQHELLVESVHMLVAEVLGRLGAV